MKSFIKKKTMTKQKINKPKCNVKLCKAACCYNVPLPKGYLSAYRKRIINPVLKIEKQPKEVGADVGLGRDIVLVITNEDISKNKCPFLREDCKCNIYDIRPHICRIFGTTPNVRFLNCEFLSGIPNKIPDSELAESLLQLGKTFDLFKSK